LSEPCMDHQNKGRPVPHRRRLSLYSRVAGWAPILLAGMLAGCAPALNDAVLPPEVESAPRVVRQAYEFAGAHPELLSRLPCYCGCGGVGHESNYDCYVTAGAFPETITYDLHALGCSICVDITRDAMRLLASGHSLPDIRAEIDRTYSAFGPSNME
jgi:hypothetical protein